MPPAPSTELVDLPVNAIRPYWRNPRNATESDISKIMASISEYGYQNPILVDSEHVIITGHTRYLALRRLGWESIPVQVEDMPAHLAKEYRIIDNRSGEFTQWDRERLMTELRSFQESQMRELFFPEVDLNATELDLTSLAPPLELPAAPIPQAQPSRIVICPNCYDRFDINDATVIEELDHHPEEEDEDAL